MTASPMRGVTRDNFVALGKAFMAGNGGAGFVPALQRYPGIGAGEPFKATPRQWGAWMAYWSRLGYRTKAMQARGYCTVPAEWPHEFDATATIMGDHAAADAFEAGWRRRIAREAEAEGAVARRDISPAALVHEARSRPRSSTRPAFRPYPALAEAMANDGRALDLLDGCTFDQMTHASKLLVSDGVEAVRRWLLDGHRVPRVRRGPTPPEHLDPTATPSVDLSDFPPANATRAELKAWEERQKEAAREPQEAAR